jgi:hypothetical protein
MIVADSFICKNKPQPFPGYRSNPFGHCFDNWGGGPVEPE